MALEEPSPVDVAAREGSGIEPDGGCSECSSARSALRSGSATTESLSDEPKTDFPGDQWTPRSSTATAERSSVTTAGFPSARPTPSARSSNATTTAVHGTEEEKPDSPSARPTPRSSEATVVANISGRGGAVEKIAPSKIQSKGKT